MLTVCENRQPGGTGTNREMRGANAGRNAKGGTRSRIIACTAFDTIDTQIPATVATDSEQAEDHAPMTHITKIATPLVSGKRKLFLRFFRFHLWDRD